ncbi:PepSY domain-containing protein [Pseudobutyrivibrio sp.]|uniref:PepSY domain-containing protein n=1 Tax=Pseudobutyrivibrio sp. TaxID=2014367 RepID=UPI0025E1F48F|nr:PepSY domain-containing protein [Pseudobutyrivibrio sp.]
MFRGLFTAALTLITALLIMSLSTPQFAFAHEVSTKTTVAEPTEVSEDYALLAALEHAGFVKDDLLYSSVEKDTEDGVEVYEVEFQVGHQEYNYEIEAATGNILSYELDN